MYCLVNSEHPLFVPVPRDQVDLCHSEDPRGWKEQGPSCEGDVVLTLQSLVGGMWKGSIESQVSFFCSFSFSPKVLLTT